VEFCHANGAVSTRRLGFSVSAEHAVDLTQWETRGALQPVAEAVGREDREAAQAALGQMQKGSAPEFAKVVARKLVATLNDEPRLAPNKVPARTRQFSLGDAQAESAETGWLKPMVNRVPMPANDPVSSPLLDAGSIYATGLFAHAPSRYVFNLGGKWKKLSGEAGLHVAHQPYGSVVFIIKTNEHEAFRSPVIRGAKKAKYDLEVTGVKKLELIVDPSEDGKHNDWGLWLEPMLVR